MKNNIVSLFLISVLFCLASCTSAPADAAKVGALPEICPDYVDVTVPSTIAPLNFDVLGDAQQVYVEVRGQNGGEIVGSGKWAKFDIDEWHSLTERNVGADLQFTVYAKVDGRWLQYDDFVVHVSQYPLDQWGLTYRRLAPGYEVYSNMGIYQRDLANFNEYPLIENTQTLGQCYNCHTSNRTDPRNLVLHVRGNHGGTMVRVDGQCTWLNSVNDSLGGAMVYPYWHPSGRYCAFSTNQTRQAFHIAGEKRIEVFDHSSDVLIYDVAENKIVLDTLLTSKTWSENIPTFSPDGKTLYFTTCLQREYPLEYKDERYNLCRVNFDAETGCVGEKVDTLFDAASMGKSVTWPRPSYDGRFILFTLNDYGYFSVWHKESEQWILDLLTGEARPLGNANSDDADSFHNWSANSRWIVFTSRRGDGLYTRLYLCEIDDDGNASKPFLLPQYNPKEYYDGLLHSYNTPDFTLEKVEFDSPAAVDEILSDKRVNTEVR